MKRTSYALSWQLGILSHYVGVGFRKGDTLHAACATRDGKSTAYVFKIEPGPKLTGDGRTHTETLTFLRARPKGDE